MKNHLNTLAPLFRRLAQAFAVATVATSCVNTDTINLSRADRTAMKGKTYTTTSRNMPEHSILKQSAMTAAVLGGAIGGGIAGSIAAQEGAKQLSKHQMPNPNATLTAEMTPFVVAKTGLRRVPSNHTSKSLDPKKVAGENPHADYVLDCFTTSWMGTYYPFSLGKYFMTYGAKMQLIETSSGRVIAQGFNFYQGNDRKNAPDYDGIYSNGAAFLKAETQRGTSGAVNKFKTVF